MFWRLAKVEKLMESSDNKVRGARVRSRLQEGKVINSQEACSCAALLPIGSAVFN